MEWKDCACYGVCPWLRTSHPKSSRQPNDGTGNHNELDGMLQNTQLQDGLQNKASIKQSATDNVDDDNNQVVRTYKRRWVMLLLFSVFSLSNAYMWIHLNIIANVVLRYYNQSLPADSLQQETAVDWLSLVYLLAYVLIIPFGMYLLDKCGLRANNVVGCTVSCLGAWLKCASASPSRFPLLMTAQALCGIGEVFVVSVPPSLAAAWFGPNELSTATAIGVFGNQLGVAIGFLAPPYIVPNSPTLTEVGHDLSIMFYGGAIICTLILLAMLLGFQARPPHPPSRAQLLMQTTRGSKEKEKYLTSVIRLMKQPSFLLIMVSYGLMTGCFYAISTLLNYMVLYYFPGEEVRVGNIGLTIVLSGIVGSILAGVWLDRSKYFKSTTLSFYILSTAAMLAYTFTLDKGHLWVIFLAAGVLGFFMTGYLPVGYEFAAEITYPEPEGTSSGLLTASAMFFGIVMTLGMRAMMNQVSILAANLFVTCVLIVGTIMTALIRARYYRQEAEEAMKSDIGNQVLQVKEKQENGALPLTSN